MSKYVTIYRLDGVINDLFQKWSEIFDGFSFSFDTGLLKVLNASVLVYVILS